MTTLRITLATLGSTALLAGAAAPAFAQDTAGTYPSDPSSGSQTQQTQQGHRRGHGRGHGRRLSDAQLTKVASALGVTLDALKTAQAEVRAAVKATDARETRAEEDALLAQKLGVTVDELRAAFDSVRPQGGEGRGRGGRVGCKGGSSSGSQGSTSGSYPSDSTATSGA